MKNINIKVIASTAIIGLFLSGCNSKSSDAVSNITNLPLCGTAIDNGKSIALDVTGKTITKVGTTTQVRIWHLPDATKLACVSSGEASFIN